jgi:hypothetical protein
MKKTIKKFWGIGLIVIILSSLFIAAVPASPVAAASPLMWNTEAIPGIPGYALLPGSDISGIAVGPDGTTIYAVSANTTGNPAVYKSTNAGISWTAVANNAGMSPGTLQIVPDLVAVAADDPDVVVIVDTADDHIRVSTTGGTQWSDLDTTELGLIIGVETIVSIDVSSEVNGIRYCAVATNGGHIATRKFGSSWEEWKDASAEYNGYAGVDEAFAVKFSPNFPSDRTMTVVSANASATLFELLVFTSVPKWNGEAGLTDYPAHIYNNAGADITDALEASIALAPDYPGGGEVESIAFIGIEAGTTTNAGVYRMDDYISTSLKRNIQVVSVAYDGEVCVAGTGDARVWRSENPMDTSPTFIGNNSMKGPGGESEALVGFAGTNVVAATYGNESAFSVSVDNGRSFSDISLIDTTIDNISDFAVSPDGTKVYMVTNDTASDVSLFRYNASGWQRVLSVTAANGGDDDFIVRVSPSNWDAVYVADTGVGSSKIFRSTAGGDTRWYTRTAGYEIADLAVESDNVLYAAIYNDVTVSKSTNGGAYFGDPVNTKLITGTAATVKVLSEDNLIVSSTLGSVSYSTNGNDSWIPIGPPVATGTAQVAATGLTDGSYLYASVGGATYRWTIGQSPIEPWADISAFPGTVPGSSTIVGAEMFGSTLYVCTANGTPLSTFMRNTLPFAAENTALFWSSPYGQAGGVVANDFTKTPTAMRLSSTSTYVKVWAAGTATLYSFMDTLVLTAPQNVSPEQGALIPLNVRSNYPYNITFLWTRPSTATYYNLFIALDPFFTESVVVKAGPSALMGTSAATQAYTLTGEDLAKLTPGTTYYWAVSAAKPMSSGFSAMPGWEFTLQAGEASVPVIAAPANGATDQSDKPAFSWLPVTGTTKYEFQLSEGTAFAVPLVDEETASTAIVVSTALEAGKTYFWRVKALEPVESDWSAIGSFTVALPPTTAPPPITVTTTPPPQITVTTPAPPPAVTIAPPETKEIAPAYIWAIIIIGAVLVIAVIVLIVRTRRNV